MQKVKHTFKILAIAFIAVTLTAFSCDKDRQGEYTGQWKVQSRASTPKGVKVESTSKKIDPRVLPEIDKGLDRLFEIASKPPYNYKLKRTHKDYQVTLFPRSPKCSTPGMITTAYQKAFDQTQWDKDPRPGHTALCFAGALMVQPGMLPGMIVVDNIGIMAEIVHWEGEHNVLLYHDPIKFNATKGNHNHPLLPDGSGNFAPEVTRTAVWTGYDGKEYCVLPVK
ncbi:MAG: hypothetical protein KF855_03565 [Acidobacteria bacterium]|nr:hypothetical protein [Acidobacteriota bacterium]